MKRILTILATVLTVAGLAVAGLAGTAASAASASTLSDCLAQHHVCVASDARSALPVKEQDQLEQQIGSDPIYIVAAASGTSGYNSAMDQLISDLGSHQQFVVGFWDVRSDHRSGPRPVTGGAGCGTRPERAC